MKPSQVSAELRRLAAYAVGPGRPRRSLVRSGIGRILRAMEEAPSTLRSPPSAPPLEGVDWDWYLDAVEDVKELIEEARDQGPDEGGYLSHSIRGYGDELKDLAMRLEQAEPRPRSAPSAGEPVHAKLGLPPVY